MYPITLKTVSWSLSDGSEVFDVIMLQNGKICARFDAVSQHDARDLICGFKDLIEAHSNEAVELA